jgi:peptidylprolyl isomerase
MMKKVILALVMGCMMATAARAADLENTIYLDTKDGRVVIELLPEKAPKHVARIKELAREGFYDGVVFHRVIDGFMAQTGDPTGTGTGGSSKPDLKAEFSDVSHMRGVVSMARAANPNSANSQFFIVLAQSTFLDRQYSAFGRVISGMEFVDQIKKGNKAANGTVENPDKIVKMTVAADEAKTVKSTEKSADAPKASKAK